LTVTYRDAKPGDADAIDGLFRATFCGTFSQLYRREDLDAFLAQFNPAKWAMQLSDPAYAFRLAEDEGEPVAYVRLGPMKLPLQIERPSILLEQLYVLPSYHGSGVARALMDWALDEARRRGAEELYLTVFIDNDRARRFYDRYSFEAVGKYDFMVGSQADEDIIMRRTL